MIMKILPKGRLGKWSVGLTFLVLLLLAIFFAFMFLDLVSFDEGHWWDFTVGVLVPVEIIAFILSTIALRKTKEQSVLTYLSFIIGICAILFLFLHSLFIND
jgi:cytochrome bd-type quinol oxidase subunit 2